MSRNFLFWLSGALSAVLHMAVLWYLIHLTPLRPHFVPDDAGVISVSLLRGYRTLSLPFQAKVPQHQATVAPKLLEPVRDAIGKSGDPIALPNLDPYFSPEELLSHAQLVTDISLNEHCRIRSKIVLKLWINETGRVDRIEKVAGTADGPCVDMAKAAFQHATFAPGRLNDKPVKCFWFVEIWNGNN